MRRRRSLNSTTLLRVPLIRPATLTDMPQEDRRAHGSRLPTGADEDQRGLRERPECSTAVSESGARVATPAVSGSRRRLAARTIRACRRSSRRRAWSNVERVGESRPCRRSRAGGHRGQARVAPVRTARPEKSRPIEARIGGIHRLFGRVFRRWVTHSRPVGAPFCPVGAPCFSTHSGRAATCLQWFTSIPGRRDVVSLDLTYPAKQPGVSRNVGAHGMTPRVGR